MNIPRKHSKRATTKQLTALKLINEGVPATRAMLQAGYSKQVSRSPKQNLFKSQAIVSIVDKFQLQLNDEGITTAYLAKKYSEWLDASRVMVTKDGEVIEQKDYQTQIKAGEMLNKIYNLTPIGKEDTENLRRRVTLEEFIGNEQ